MKPVARNSREHISWTQIQMYLRCSMQYRFRYVLGLKEPPNLNMATGSAGHNALQLNAESKIETGKDQPLEQLLDNFSDSYTKEVAEIEKSELGRDDDIDAKKDGTIKVLTKYHIEEAPLVTPIVAELEFEVPIEATEEFHEPSKPIVGKIDIIQKKERKIERFPMPIEQTQIIDDKFPKRLPGNLQDLADLNDQLTMYDYATTRSGKQVDELGFQHFVPPTKTLDARLFQTYRSSALMTPKVRETRHERLLFKIRQVTRAIREGIFIPVDNPQTCNQCGYKRICQYSLAKDDYDKMQTTRGTSWPAPEKPKNPLPSALKTSNDSSKPSPPKKVTPPPLPLRPSVIKSDP